MVSVIAGMSVTGRASRVKARAYAKITPAMAVAPRM